MELGLTLPPLRQPAGSYRGWRHAGDLLFLSGQGADGHVGRVGDDLTLEQGQAAARACALNLLAQTRDALGSLDRVAEIVKVLGFVCCTPDFTQQPLVINGASDLLRSVFGEEIGSHARSAIGVYALPLGFAVEIEMVVRVNAAGLS